MRAVAFFLLLAAFGVGWSLPLALLLLRTGAAAAALPVGLAGTATQVGAGGAALIATGVDATRLVDVAVSIGVLGVVTGTAVFVAAILWRGSWCRCGRWRISRLGETGLLLPWRRT